jgi:hypothetical protein
MGRIRSPKRAVEVDQAPPMLLLLGGHVVEDRRRRRVLLAKPAGVEGVDAPVFLLRGDRQGEHLLRREAVETPASEEGQGKESAHRA